MLGCACKQSWIPLLKKSPSYGKNSVSRMPGWPELILRNGLTIHYLNLSPRIIWSWPWHKDLRQVAIGSLSCYQGRMNTVLDLFKNLWNLLVCIGELLG